jgi:hypothetical protein
MKRIKESAIIHKGVVWTGRRHHNIIADIVSKTGDRPVTGEQGFVTEDGEFVNREDAAKIALSNGQVKELKFNSKLLFSEDLY